MSGNLAEILRRAAAGRQHYADNCPPGDNKQFLEGEAHAFEQAARLAEGAGPELMCGILPTLMWSEAEYVFARSEEAAR